jgi:hypothetical protein
VKAFTAEAFEIFRFKSKMEESYKVGKKYSCAHGIYQAATGFIEYGYFVFLFFFLDFNHNFAFKKCLFVNSM